MTGRYFIARHGETVFNAAARMQGDAPHTPLTRTGFAQAEAIGEALRTHLGPRPRLTLFSSPAGRALQTLAIIAEHLELDWHEARIDARLAELDVGDWSGRHYREIEAEEGPFVDRERGLFTRRPPNGEGYEELSLRLGGWLADTAGPGDRIVVTHGIASQVLRALLTGLPPRPECGAPVADPLPQGSLVTIAGGEETLLLGGTGGFGASKSGLTA